MGYDLKIGELQTWIDYDGLDSWIVNDVVDEKHDNAPAFGEFTDYTNYRAPGYGQWDKVMRDCGLHELMFDEDTGLIRNHPGCVPLVKEHKEIIDKAYKEFYEKYPNCKAGYSPKINNKEGIYDDPDWDNCNNTAVRLEWLKYWVDWALENCERPVFYNS